MTILIRMLIAIFAVLLAPAAAHAQAYDSGTVPDEQGRQALLNRAPDIGRDNISIHSNFPQIIEQNFAAMRPVKAAAVIDNLTDIELSNLKQFYAAANFDANRESRLLPILAYRLNAKRLARIARHFGYAETYAAVSGYSPEKLVSFSVAYANEPAPAAVAQGGGIGRFLGFTPHEIYLDFRTAPVGSLGVTGALYETAAVLGSAISVSYGAGYTAGSAAAYLIETYSPSTWDAIGGTVAGMVDNMTQAYDLATLG
ncbi:MULTISPECIES: hypothetical protein [unclassified Rubrivivax]|uniref:hypothetical protein n=1 Tax=unclassified Rubrivivax TaxID=2649762 RepID=UPI001E57C914|nr:MULTISPECIES: hypothetical protein [unclassified Rubrivivax]MCC9595948.1 hypothetical protein [Rubrivivax sp. JA1055]MCC9647711.1 hypothetical protein [Rubrivivax sp. JA1029]